MASHSISSPMSFLTLLNLLLPNSLSKLSLSINMELKSIALVDQGIIILSLTSMSIKGLLTKNQPFTTLLITLNIFNLFKE